MKIFFNCRSKLYHLIIVIFVGIYLCWSSELTHSETHSSQSFESINQISNSLGAINVYFNKSALTQYAPAGNLANYNVNLEKRLLLRLKQASSTIDIAAYEINLINIVNTLITQAALGIRIRFIVDAKPGADEKRNERYSQMRLALEKMARGADGRMGSEDDIIIFSDSVIFAVENTLQRQAYGLRESPQDLVKKTITLGDSTQTGYLIAQAEQKNDGSYYAPNQQMHNKFVIIDNRWLWTGSWNFTVTGLYGSEQNRLAGILDGNQQHSIELHSPELAKAYLQEFNKMWGSPLRLPNPANAKFHARKKGQATEHSGDTTKAEFTIGGRRVEVYFSPADNALQHVTHYVRDKANHSALFTIFAWSDQSLLDELKLLWEGSKINLQGNRTKFVIKGVYDSSFWQNWWSASIDMTGRKGSAVSVKNPNTRWANSAPVFPDKEVRKLHSKTMIIDACTDSDPAVIIGSTNWSNNGNNINDENLLIIHDAALANQFVQEFAARYQAASAATELRAIGD